MKKKIEKYRVNEEENREYRGNEEENREIQNLIFIYLALLHVPCGPVVLPETEGRVDSPPRLGESFLLLH